MTPLAKLLLSGLTVALLSGTAVARTDDGSGERRLLARGRDTHAPVVVGALERSTGEPVRPVLAGVEWTRGPMDPRPIVPKRAVAHTFEVANFRFNR